MNQPGPRRSGEETRRSVLRAAEEVFARVGYAGARMEDIADRSGIRRASFVHYYRDKPTLYGAPGALAAELRSWVARVLFVD